MHYYNNYKFQEETESENGIMYIYNSKGWDLT